MRRTVGIAVDLLNPPVREAFTLVFPTAQSKSIVNWVLRAVGEADVVCCEPQHATMLAPNLRRNQLRLWFAPRVVAEPYTADGDVSIDPGEVHVFSVLHALDMAALRFIDGARYPRYADAVTNTVTRTGTSTTGGHTLTITAAATVAPVTGGVDGSLATDGGTRYSIQRWVQLGGMFRKRHHLHATALMARQELTFEQLVMGSGMMREDALDLLRELRRVGVLRQNNSLSSATDFSNATATASTSASAHTTANVSTNDDAVSERDTIRPLPPRPESPLQQLRVEGTRGMLGRLRAWLSRDIGRPA